MLALLLTVSLAACGRPESQEMEETARYLNGYVQDSGDTQDDLVIYALTEIFITTFIFRKAMTEVSLMPCLSRCRDTKGCTFRGWA